MLKYIMFNDNDFVIFPDYIGHNEIKINKGITSAGFCMLNGNKDGSTKVSVWGDSSSLKVKSKEKDAIIIERKINEHLN